MSIDCGREIVYNITSEIEVHKKITASLLRGKKCDTVIHQDKKSYLKFIIHQISLFVKL